jgi:hypothetical protein
VGRGEIYIHSILVGKPKENKPLGIPRRRWKDNINMYLYEVGCGDMDWIDLAKDRDSWRGLANAVTNHSGSLK